MNENRNALWGRVVAEELVRSGVRDACLSPGSRSTPLALALHAQREIRITVHADERSGAFFALGIAKARRAPVALVCTSGTAAANYLPAVVEARLGRTPLIVLTADRPPELHDVGANQSIDQQNIYGTHAKWFADAGVPQVDGARVRHLRALVDRAVAVARRAPAGPVHLNFPFQEPLEPRPVPGDIPSDWSGGHPEADRGRADGRPYLDIPAVSPQPEEPVLDEFAKRIRGAKRGLIVAGPRSPEPDYAQVLWGLARATGFPILADPLSGLRYGAPSDVTVCSAYDAWMTVPAIRTALAPDLVLRVGAAPTSKSFLAFLASGEPLHQVVIDESEHLGEATNRAHAFLTASPAVIAEALVGRLRAAGPSDWTRRVATIEKATRGFHEAQLPTRGFEGAIAARLVRSLPENAALFVSNSLPVRDLDRFGDDQGRRLHVYGNRGASGIDGILSAAAGVAQGTGARVTLLTGDLAFLHDLSGLQTARRLGLPLDIVALNNDGGGIFEFLPIAGHGPPFEELFVAPHGQDLAPLAEAMGVPSRTTDAGTWRPQPSVGDGPSLIEIKCRREANVQHRRELEALLAKELGPLVAEVAPGR